MRLFDDRKGKLPIAVLICIAIGLLIVFVTVGPGKRIIDISHRNLMAFGEEKCDDASRNRRAADFQDDVEVYASRTRAAGGVNELYEPLQAVREYKRFKACFIDGDRTAEQQVKDATETAVKLAYRNHAADLCTQYLAQTESGAKRELKKQFLDLEEDYYKTLVAGSDAKVPLSFGIPPQCCGADKWGECRGTRTA